MQKTTLYDAVNTLYQKINLDGVSTIHQRSLRGASQIEYVRMYDMICILFRLKDIILESSL